MSSKQVRVALTREEADFIGELAEAEGITFSEEVRQLIKLGLEIKASEAGDQLTQLAYETEGHAPTPAYWSMPTAAVLEEFMKFRKSV